MIALSTGHDGAGVVVWMLDGIDAGLWQASTYRVRAVGAGRLESVVV